MLIPIIYNSIGAESWKYGRHVMFYFSSPLKGGLIMEEKRVHVNEKYKDSIFCILYQDDKERQLELYNSVSGKN